MRALKWYGPLLKATASPLIAFGLVLSFHYYFFSFLILASWKTNSLGILYTHIFEYLHHRFALHYGLPGLKWMKASHHEHHRVFHRLNYKTRHPADLEEISSRWYIFPVLLFVHYFAFVVFLPKTCLAIAPAFFLGVLLRFLAYDTTHYFSHLENNFFDRWIAHLPLLRHLRAYQDRHHHYHHIRQGINFGFVPDYLPDWIGRTLFPPFKFNRRR